MHTKSSSSFLFDVAAVGASGPSDYCATLHLFFYLTMTTNERTSVVYYSAAASQKTLYLQSSILFLKKEIYGGKNSIAPSCALFNSSRNTISFRLELFIVVLSQ